MIGIVILGVILFAWVLLFFDNEIWQVINKVSKFLQRRKTNY